MLGKRPPSPAEAGSSHGLTSLATRHRFDPATAIKTATMSDSIKIRRCHRSGFRTPVESTGLQRSETPQPETPVKPESTHSFDPARYKAEQRQGWDSVAAAWKKWRETFERSAQPVSDFLVELAQIRPGHRVLDVATGTGEPALTAARRVGPTGRVVATDQSSQMLAIARERATALGLQNVEFRQMDAEALDLPENTFDAVLCRWALMFFPDLAGCLGRLRLLLIPGGCFATAVWDVPEKVPMISLTTRVVTQMLGEPPVPPGTPNPFNLADTARLERMLAQAGFNDARNTRLTITFEFPSAEAYVSFRRDVAGPRIPHLVNQPPERQAAVWEALTEAARQHAAPDGRVRLPCEVLCVLARR